MNVKTYTTSFPSLTANAVKLIAVIAMTADHLAWWLLQTDSFSGQLIHFFGRLTMPIMCFFVAEGFRYTKSIQKYAFRLALFAALSHFPYVFFFGHKWYSTTSVMFTLLLGLLAVTLCDKFKDKQMYALIAVVLCCILSYRSDWSYTAILWTVAAYMYRYNKNYQLASFAVIGLVAYALPQFLTSGHTMLYPFGFLLAIPVLLLYKGERGKKNTLTKWGFYVYYPAHLMVLLLFKYLIAVKTVF